MSRFPKNVTHVLAILVATKRTVPLSTFAEAFRLAESRARLEALNPDARTTDTTFHATRRYPRPLDSTG